MDQGAFYELMLDNIPDGIYILDGAGDYLYVNTAYVRALSMSKTELLHYNVRDFIKTGQITSCISDIVYREKRRVVMFQDVQPASTARKLPFRQLVISNPVFGPDGEVQNIVAVCKPLDTLNHFYHEASVSGMVANYAPLATAAASSRTTVVAESPVMRHILSMAGEIADVDTAVLISGESGTGKEVVAQYIHSHGKRSGKNLVVVNCASLPENLLEAELFGYEKGAFTGASPTGKMGLFEAAAGGTLFLDEINSLPYALQGKLLRAIETKTIQRLGSTQTKKVDFRLISATNEDLWQAVEDKRFRADLFYRLNVIPLLLPPLRERAEDIMPLAIHFLEHYNAKYNKNKLFAAGTIDNMLAYDWPGNVRELKNFVERSVVMSASDYIEISNIQPIAASHSGRGGQYDPTALPLSAQGPQPDGLLDRGLPLAEYLEHCERAYLAQALSRYKSSYAAAAALGTSQSAIMRRKKKYGL